MTRTMTRLAAAALVAAGCGGDVVTDPPDDTVEPAVVVRVTVSPVRDWITSFRYRRRFRATAYDADQLEITGRKVTWTTSDPAILAVDSGGMVTPVWEGTATITASIDGISGAAEVTVAPELMAFVSERTGDWEIYAVARDGTGTRNLSQHPAHDEEPQWSPDGSRIAFRSERDGDGDIYVMNADGSGLVNASETATDVSPYISWSPDGSRLVYASIEAPGIIELYVVGADGSGRTPLTQCGCRSERPEWSPDGTRIAFHSVRDTLTYPEIFTVAADGSDLLNLTNHQSADEYPRWSPDGRTILFLTGRDGPWRLYTMSSSGADPRRLVDMLPGPALWSPDGIWVAFIGSGLGTAFYVIRPDGTGRSRLGPEHEWVSFFSWSPDSQELAITVSTATEYGPNDMNIAAVNLAGERESIVTSLGHDRTPRIRPRRP